MVFGVYYPTGIMLLVSQVPLMKSKSVLQLMLGKAFGFETDSTKNSKDLPWEQISVIAK